MKLQIYAEDTYCRAIAILAEKAARHWYDQRGGVPSIRVLATSMTVSQMYKNMPSLINQAKKDGCGCVAFVIDREGPSSRHHRPQESQQIQHAFDDLCKDPPDQVKVMLIIADICLESWLLADAEGLVAFVVRRKGKATNYRPPQHRTDLNGRDSRDHAHAITKIFQNVERSLGVGHPRLKYDKVESDQIAKWIEPIRGSEWNKSLEYFCEMVPCRRDGCKDRQPAIAE